MNVVVLALGDIGGDGHGLTREYRVSCNLTADELFKSFEIGEAIAGVKFAEAFDEYEASTLDAAMNEQLSKFIDTGCPQGDDAHLWAESYIHIWVQLARLGNPDLEIDYLPHETTIHIGGYGLFSN